MLCKFNGYNLGRYIHTRSVTVAVTVTVIGGAVVVTVSVFVIVTPATSTGTIVRNGADVWATSVLEDGNARENGA